MSRCAHELVSQTLDLQFANDNRIIKKCHWTWIQSQAPLAFSFAPHGSLPKIGIYKRHKATDSNPTERKAYFLRTLRD